MWVSNLLPLWHLSIALVLLSSHLCCSALLVVLVCPVVIVSNVKGLFLRGQVIGWERMVPENRENAA